MSGLRQALARIARREQVLMEGQGFYAETFPTLMYFGSTLLVSQSVYGVARGLLAGDIVANLSVRLTTSGNTVTLAKCGVYSKAGVLLRASADQSALMNAAAGTKTFPMSTPLEVPADDLYYLGFLAVSAVTMPQLARAGAFTPVAATSPVGAGSSPLVIQTGQADLPAPATFVSAPTCIGLWFGVS